MPKKIRYADRLEAEDPKIRLGDVHLLIGGTGAVGGETLMKMLRIYGDMRRLHRIPPDVAGPIIVATGQDPDELGRFRTHLFDVAISESTKRPTRSGDTLRMHNDALVVLREFKFEMLPALKAWIPSGAELAAYTSQFEGEDSLVGAIGAEVHRSRPLGGLLDSVREEINPSVSFGRYRSVQFSIPLPSLLAYHLDMLDDLQTKGLLTPDEADDVKRTATQHLVNQLREVRSNADHVLIAHTTGVGGMYDVSPSGGVSTIRLGFAHAAIDSHLQDKRDRAAKFSELYAEAGIWNVCTAAAIGVDHVEIDRPLKLEKEMVKGLRTAKHEPFPGSRNATVVHVHPPKNLRIDENGSDEPLAFERMERGHELRPRFALRSGENGFMSVANAEALYRVMHVASPSELGAVMSLVGALGDDPVDPWFRGEGDKRECYYTETDNSRLVFDFLSQPQLRAMQLSGLEPQALVNLGSAKHQAELHMLGLLILLHRLHTLDLDAVPAFVRSLADVPGSSTSLKRARATAARFDVDAFVEQNSHPLTFEDIQQWDVEELERDLRILVLAETPADLLPLKNFRAKRQDALLGHRAEVRNAIFERVIEAVQAITSLGTPFVFTGDDGRTLVRTGWWVAPLSLVAETEGSIAHWFEKRRVNLEKVGRSWTTEQLAHHHFAVNGFIDLRRHAIVASSRTDQNSSDTVVVAQTERELEDAIGNLTPFKFFSTCGLLAVHYRLKCLGDYIQAAQSQIQLGTHHDAAWAIPRDHREHTLVVPGIVEAFRMVSEGLEKVTGTEILSGNWGYRWVG